MSSITPFITNEHANVYCIHGLPEEVIAVPAAESTPFGNIASGQEA